MNTHIRLPLTQAKCREGRLSLRDQQMKNVAVIALRELGRLVDELQILVEPHL